MSVSEIIGDVEAGYANLLSYSLVSSSPLYKKWTKSGDGWNSRLISKAWLNAPFDDQSVRLVLPSIDYRMRFGFCSYSKAGIGIAPELGWDIIPDAAELVTFSDDFTADALDSVKWQNYNGSPTVDLTGDKLRLTVSSSIGLRSVNSFNFLDGFCSMRIPIVASNANVTNGFLLSASDSLSTYWAIDEYNGNLRMFWDGGSTSIAYDAVNHLYKRIDLTATQAIFKTSPDGTTWTTRHTATSNASKNSLYIYLRPFASGSRSVDYDDVKAGSLATTKAYKVIESGTVVATSGQTPSVDDELRVQIIKVSGSYKARYHWRDDSGSGESQQYESGLSSAAIAAYFPLMYKLEIFSNNGFAKNPQIETGVTPSNFDYFSRAAQDAGVFDPHVNLQLTGKPIELDSGYVVPTIGQLFPRGLPYKND